MIGLLYLAYVARRIISSGRGYLENRDPTDGIQPFIVYVIYAILIFSILTSGRSKRITRISCRLAGSLTSPQQITMHQISRAELAAGRWVMGQKGRQILIGHT
jgi:hypothetical protein